MTDVHPSDDRLLLVLEDEAPEDVADHLTTCDTCRALVEDALAGQAVLRAAPLLEFPTARREALLGSLPAQDAVPAPERQGRWRASSPWRLLRVAVPAAALAGIVAAVALTGGGTDAERLAEEMAQDAGVEATPEAAREAPSAMEAPGDELPAVRRVEGPPEAVAELLRGRGFDARVEGEAVIVTGADAAAVEEALRERAEGDVEVRLG
jgi:hypothetical protein